MIVLNVCFSSLSSDLLLRILFEISCFGFPAFLHFVFIYISKEKKTKRVLMRWDSEEERDIMKTFARNRRN